MANERSPTVTHRDGRTSRRLEVDEHRRSLCLELLSTTRQLFEKLHLKRPAVDE